MGLDRFANFLSKFINNDGIDRLNIENNIRKVVVNHVILDLNFLIYQEIIEIENEVNDILKILISCKNSNNINILYKLINEITDKPYWKINKNILLVLNNIENENILDDFIKLLFSKIDNNKIIDLIIYEKIIYNIKYYITNIHYYEFIHSINIFYDGIPSYSKIIEQRKRRIKNHLEYTEKKKLFKIYFDKLLTNNIDITKSLSKKYKTLLNFNDIITFDYLYWIKNRFSIDKSIGPSSLFILNLDIYISKHIYKYFPDKKINIFNSKENGEADLKIFKFIALNKINGDYCIHTSDSDLIHQMLVQQIYYKIMNRDINISLIKYIKNYNLVGYVQFLDANIIIKNILDLYNISNNVKTNNYKIIWDLCLIFYLFGNDHIPASLEIGPELSLDYYLMCHYQSIYNNNIVNLNNNNIDINLENLLLLLFKINSTNKINITKIILQRFFKINYKLIQILTENFNFNFNEILLFLEKFILYRTLELSNEEQDNINIHDIRKILLLKYKNNLDIYKNINIFNFNIDNINILNNSIDIIENNIDYYEYDYMGLILYNKSQNITLDPYQDLYNYISEKTISNIIKKHSIYYDHIDLNSHINILNIKDNSDVDSYLKKLYHLVITQFGNMKKYHSNNLTYYKYYYAPSINNMIIYLQKNNHNNIIKTWNKIIINDNINNYFNDYNHHILISPFIINYNLMPEVKILIEYLNIKNLWLYDINNFNYRDIDIIYFLNKWNNIIKLFNKNNLLYIQDII